MENHNKPELYINSLDNSRKAEPSEEFLLRMEQLALRYITVVDKISLRAILGIAATFLLLLIVNVMIMKKSTVSSNTQSSGEMHSSSYDLIPTKSLYNE